MSSQSIKRQLLAASLFTLSTCGTLALFGSVPVIARILSDLPAQDSTSLPFGQSTSLR
ncbi:MAG: hypothetical protein ACKO7W_06120 [Elainella sp.]